MFSLASFVRSVSPIYQNLEWANVTLTQLFATSSLWWTAQIVYFQLCREIQELLFEKCWMFFVVWFVYSFSVDDYFSVWFHRADSSGCSLKFLPGSRENSVSTFVAIYRNCFAKSYLFFLVSFNDFLFFKTDFRIGFVQYWCNNSLLWAFVEKQW